MHFFSFQIIVLVHITYLHNLDYDLVIQISKIVKEVHYYASIEKDHDTLFVQHAFKLHWEFFKSKGTNLECMLCGLIVVTGCSKMLELGTFWEGIITTQCVSSCHQVARWSRISLPLGMAKGTCRWSLCLTKKIITKGGVETSRTKNSKC